MAMTLPQAKERGREKGKIERITFSTVILPFASPNCIAGRRNIESNPYMRWNERRKSL